MFPSLQQNIKAPYKKMSTPQSTKNIGRQINYSSLFKQNIIIYSHNKNVYIRIIKRPYAVNDLLW